MAARKTAAEASRPSPPTRAAPAPGVPVVGIGASAGGLEALKELFAALPADSGCAFVIALHLAPTQCSILPGLLARQTAMPVAEAGDGMRAEPDHVYILPPNKYLSIRDGVLHLAGPVEPAGAALAIDHFFGALAADRRERAIGILLSGTGSYGTHGLRAVKAQGGLVIVQDPETAAYPDMPRSAIAADVQDYVLPVAQMPAALGRYLGHDYANGRPVAAALEQVHHILAFLQAEHKLDFRGYRPAILQRRIERRVGVCHLAGLPEYLGYLRQDPDEVQRLVRDLLIGVTSYFRDPAAFQALATQNSANEELEASRQELQALNEELVATNTALREKMTELAAAHDDLSNFFHSSDVATVFLDRDLCLRRATPAATRLCRLAAADLGRPVAALASPLLDGTLSQDAAQVLRDLTPIERELRTPDGRCYLRRALPYRTRDDRIDGVVVTLSDATALKRSGEALRQLNAELEQRVAARTAELQAQVAESARLAAIVESSDDAIVGKDLDGTITSWNAGAERIYGYSAREALGRPIAFLAPPERAGEIATILERLRKGEHIDHFKTRRLRKDGREIVVSVSISPVRDAAGKVIAASAIARDITEQERLEGLLRFQGQVAAHMAEGICMVRERDATIVFTNESFERLFGYAPGELAGRPVAVLNAAGAESPEETAAHIVRQLREEGVWRGEVSNVKKDGTPFWSEYSVSTFEHPEHGRIWVGVQNDITERKRAEQALRDSRERLQAILNSAADAVITIDGHGLIESVNPAAEKMFGYTAAEMIGQNVDLLMPAPYREQHDRALANYPMSGVSKVLGSGREVQGRRKDGSVFPLELAVSEMNHLRLFTGILRDVTRRKELEREVLEVAAAEQWRIGQELHDSTGQELTALGLLAEGLVDVLRQRSATEVALAVKMAAGVRRAQAQVRDLARGLIPVEVDAAGLMAALAALAGRTRGVNGVRGTFDCPEPVMVEDNQTATQLYRIAQEAVANALRHSQARQLTIALAGDAQSVTLRVCDDGVGVPPEAAEGPGLGLKIMRYRAELLGARLSIAAAAPRGTLVTCSLTKGKPHVPQQEHE